MRCDSPEGGYAVLLEAAAPGWRAEVDGTPVALAVADGLFRAVPIPPGPHRIEFLYRTPGLRAGALVAVVSWGSLALFVIEIRPRRKVAA